MPRVARRDLPDGMFHVTGRGVAREAVFRDGIDYADFERQLLKVRDEFEWTLHAYCLLPNHYHLIVETSRSDLSSGMQRLNGRYAQRFNQRYDRVGHVCSRTDSSRTSSTARRRRVWKKSKANFTSSPSYWK